MKTFKIGLCFVDEEGDIVANKILNSHWSVNPKQDLRKSINPSIRDEMASILLEGIQKGLTKEVIKEMLDELE